MSQPGRTRVVVYGSRPDGHAKVLAELFAEHFDLAGLIDDFAENAGRRIGELEVLGDAACLPDLPGRGIAGLLLGFGGARHRTEVLAAAQRAGLELPVCRHPTSFVADSAQLGPGVQILPGASVGPDCRVGAGTLINVGAILTHDVVVAPGSAINPGAVLTGRSQVAGGTEIGARAVVLPDVRVGAGVMVGAGAVVHRDVANGLTVAGVPAQPLPARRS